MASAAGRKRRSRQNAAVCYSTAHSIGPRWRRTRHLETPLERIASQRTPMSTTHLPAGPDASRVAARDDEDRISRFLTYTLSLPERVVRSTVGVTAGAARETAHALVPQAFQSSKVYELVIANSLNFLTEDIGGVEQQARPGEAPNVDHLLARKAVGNFVDLAGLATLHLSPIWLFAVVSDVAYGSK